MNLSKSLCLPAILLMALVCSFTTKKETIPVLPLLKAINNQEEILTGDFITSLTYIPLETTPECLINNKPDITLTEKYIIIKTVWNKERKILLFDRLNGKFIRQIGHFGKDPGGYSAFLFYNDATSTFYFRGWKKNIIKYSIEGEEKGSTLFPAYTAEGHITDNFDYLEENKIICYFMNAKGTEDWFLNIYDEKGNDVFSIPNHYKTKEHIPYILQRYMLFYHYDNKLFYNEMLSDTIFNISSKGATPYMILQKGGVNLTYDGEIINNMLPVYVGVESERFFSIRFYYKRNDYYALYDKSTTSFKVYKDEKGIKNNTDGFMPFAPSSSYKEQFAGLIEGSDMAAWFEKNRDLKGKLSPELQKFASKEVTDNPVVVIATLKK